MLKGRRIGITGATGFLGSHLATGLAARGAEVVGIVRNPDRGQALRDAGIVLRRADLLDADSLVQAFEGLDAVVANASPSTGDADGDIASFVQRDRQATTNAVEAALAAGVTRYVQISSVAVYKMRWPWQILASDHPRRQSGSRRDLGSLITRRGYADCKATSEEVIWAAVGRGLRPTVLRPGPVYGSGDSKLTARWTNAMRSRVRFVPTLGLPHVHAGDVAAAVAGALANDASVGRAYNVTGEVVSLFRIAQAVREANGSGPWLVPVPVPLWMGWDNRDTEHELGVSYRSLADGWREVMEA